MATKRLLLTEPLPTLPPLVAEKWQTAGRDCGRRIVVKDAAGTVVFDTDDHYDIGNAFNSFETWLNAQVGNGTYALTR